jgi:hypothetical protein
MCVIVDGVIDRANLEVAWFIVLLIKWALDAMISFFNNQ